MRERGRRKRRRAKGRGRNLPQQHMKGHVSAAGRTPNSEAIRIDITEAPQIPTKRISLQEMQLRRRWWRWGLRST